MNTTEAAISRFIEDMVRAVSTTKATDKQREIGKAWLRHAIAFALLEEKKRSDAGSEL